MRIAIVDDDPIVCQSLETILTATGTADVLWSANDGGAAIRRYFESPENHPDILLIDIQMPGMNGLDAAREILMLMPSMTIQRFRSPSVTSLMSACGTCRIVRM